MKALYSCDSYDPGLCHVDDGGDLICVCRIDGENVTANRRDVGVDGNVNERGRFGGYDGLVPTLTENATGEKETA